MNGYIVSLCGFNTITHFNELLNATLLLFAFFSVLNFSFWFYIYPNLIGELYFLLFQAILCILFLKVQRKICAIHLMIKIM